MLKLDLGCGQTKAEGYTGVDVWEGADVVFDIMSGQVWPWEDNSVDGLRASHVIEHIPADYVRPYKISGDKMARSSAGNLKDRLFFFFDEAHRVCKPGGCFQIIWPSLKSSDAFRDPTHRRFLPLEFTHYLSKGGREMMRVDHYEVDCDWIVGHAELRPFPPETFGRKQWTTAELGGLWDAQASFTVDLYKAPRG